MKGRIPKGPTLQGIKESRRGKKNSGGIQNEEDTSMKRRKKIGGRGRGHWGIRVIGSGQIPRRMCRGPFKRETSCFEKSECLKNSTKPESR